MSKHGKIFSFILLFAFVVGISGCKANATPLPYDQQIKELVLSTDWDDAKNSTQRAELTQQLAEAYVYFSKSTRVTSQELIDSTTYYATTGEFVAAVQTVEPGFEPSPLQWGYTNYATNKVFIDLEQLESQSSVQSPIAGLALLDGLWHEWTHMDVLPRTEGTLLNNPSMTFYSPVSNSEEVYLQYRGGAIYTQSYYGMLTFDEVWVESITVRRMIEQLGLKEVISAGNYYVNGVDFFPKLTQAAGISLDDMYSMHANSDFEGFAIAIGEKLPVTGDSLAKGVNLFVAIHISDKDFITRLGAFQLIEK